MTGSVIVDQVCRFITSSVVTKRVSGYIYYPPVDSCFGAYRQGPCPQTYHLILKPDKVVSECVVNPCEEGFARFVQFKNGLNM